MLKINKDAFKKYIEDIDKHIELTKLTNKSLIDWMNPIINSLTDDGAVPYLLNTNERFRASPLSSTIIWLGNAGLLSSDVLRTMQIKLLFLKDECQENDPKGNYDKYEDDKDGWSLAEGVSIWSANAESIRWGSVAQATHRREGEAGYNVFLAGIMGDTQRSQTISTESRKIARTAVCNSTPIEWGMPPVLTGETSLIKIKLLAQSDPELVFTSVVHRIDFDLLKG